MYIQTKLLAATILAYSLSEDPIHHNGGTGEDSCAEKTEHTERYKPYSEIDRDRQTSTHCPGVRGIVQGS